MGGGEGTEEDGEGFFWRRGFGIINKCEKGVGKGEGGIEGEENEGEEEGERCGKGEEEDGVPREGKSVKLYRGFVELPRNRLLASKSNIFMRSKFSYLFCKMYSGQQKLVALWGPLQLMQKGGPSFLGHKAESL